MRRKKDASVIAGGLVAAFAWVGATQDVPVQEGDPASQATETYRRAVERSNRPIDHYNLGTALLREGRVADAQEPLERSLASDREVVRISGQYNYGLSTALDGRFGQQDPEGRRRALGAARDAFRDVLRARPSDDDARWNLELVDSWLKEEEQQSGGQSSQGGQAESPGGAGAGGAPAGGQGQDRMLSPEEAAALLQQAGDAESSIRDRVMGRNRFRDPVVQKNW
jgi:tetratricopeptide (TPR) repeat protein